MKFKGGFKNGFKNLLSSKIVLYTVVIAFFLNIIAFITKNDIYALMSLIGTAVIIYISNISKNMIVVLGGALLVYYFIITIAYSFGLLRVKNGSKKEGMENNDDSTKKAELKKESEFKKTIKKINQNAPTSSQGLVMTPIEQQSNTVITNTKESNVNSGDESFEVGRNKKNSQGYNIDYASTVEDAYDELNKILGSDGIKRLTNDTQNLMKQQLQLAESMKSMQPLIAGMAPIMEQAKGLLGNIGENGNLGNLSKMVEKFSSTTGNGVK